MQQDRTVHRIPGLPNCLVDGFRHSLDEIEPSERVFILTHFHRDHYTGITQNWNAGRIYCTPITARLLVNVLKLKAVELVYPVEIGESVTISGKNKVTFLDANHCPGAAMLLFGMENGLVHLHTGDMRYHSRMKHYPALQNLKIDRIFLDTTYAHPKHKFRPQEEAIADIIVRLTDFIQRHGDCGLIFLSAYNLGKERVIFALSDAIQRPIYMDEEKIHIMNQLDGGRERVANGLFTSDPLASNIHICGMGFAGSMWAYFKANFENIDNHMNLLNDMKKERGLSVRPFTHALAFIPTGWAESSTYNRTNSLQTQNNLAVQLIAYSEHSQYNELMDFVGWLKPREVVPTVFADDRNRLFIIHLFRNLVDRRQNMQNFLDKFNVPAASTAATSNMNMHHQISISIDVYDSKVTDDERDLANEMEKSMSVDEPTETNNNNMFGPSVMRKSSSTRMFSLLENLPSISTQGVVTVPPILTGVASGTPQSKNGSPNSVNSARSGSKRGIASAEMISNEEVINGDGSGRSSNNSSTSAKKAKTSPGGSKGLIQMTMDQMLPPINSARSTHSAKDEARDSFVSMSAFAPVLSSSSTGISDWTWQCSACTFVNKSAAAAITMRDNPLAQPKEEETCAVCSIPRTLPAGGGVTEVINLLD